MTALKQITTTAFVFALLTSSTAAKPAKDKRSADAIVEEFLEIDPITYGGAEALLSVVLVNNAGHTRKREMVMKNRRDDDIRRSFMRFLGPADIAGTSFLGINNDGDRKQYFFLPALGRERRVGESQRNSRFAGTDYSYADLDSRDIEDSKRKRLSDVEVASKKAYQIELTPSDKRSEYKRLLLFIDQKSMLPLAIKYFDKKNREAKRFITMDAKKLDGKWVIARSKMVDLKKNHATEMNLKKIDFSDQIPLEQFSVRALKRD